MHAHTLTTQRPWRWAFSTLGCAEFTLEQCCDLAREFSITAIELRALEDRLDLPAYFAERFGTPAELKHVLARRGIAVPVLDTSFHLINPTPEACAELLAFVPWAEGLGVPYLRVFEGGQFDPQVDPALLDAACATIAWWRGERARNGWNVDLLMETHDAFCSAAHCLALQQQLDPPLAVLWDSHHPWFKNREPVEETWRALKSCVRHIHLKDSMRTPRGSFPLTHVVPGQGAFPLRALLELLTRDGYDGYVSLEWERKWHPYLPPLRDALTALRTLGLLG